jgi:hypothetical protein
VQDHLNEALLASQDECRIDVEIAGNLISMCLTRVVWGTLLLRNGMTLFAKPHWLAANPANPGWLEMKLRRYAC